MVAGFLFLLTVISLVTHAKYMVHMQDKSYTMHKVVSTIGSINFANKIWWSNGRKWTCIWRQSNLVMHVRHCQH